MSSPSILIVEDNKTLRRLLEYRLSKHYDVRAAVDGEDALRQISDRLPDLIVSDIMMPRMDGFALLSILRQDDRTRTIPFIFLTAKSDDPSRLRGLGEGVDDYITKPFDIDFLLMRIERILERAEIYQTQLNARIGRDFSDRLMPKSMPTVAGYHSRFFSQPKDDGGGDLFDWTEIRPGVFILMIADIMGKGLQAKFYAFSFLSYVRSMVYALAENDDSPASLLTHVNRMLAKDEVLEETFASMLVLRWDAEAGTITYANAGHCRPILVMEDRTGIVEHSELILGLDPDETYTDRSFTMPHDSALLVYTDGLVEQISGNGEPFGEVGLAGAAAQAFRAEQPVHTMLDLLLRHSREPHFGDDILVFWLQRLPVHDSSSDSDTRRMPPQAVAAA